MKVLLVADDGELLEEYNSEDFLADAREDFPSDDEKEINDGARECMMEYVTLAVNRIWKETT